MRVIVIRPRIMVVMALNVVPNLFVKGTAAATAGEVALSADFLPALRKENPECAPSRTTPPLEVRTPRVLFDGTHIAFVSPDGSVARRFPAHNQTRCGHAPGHHTTRPNDPGCQCPILPGVYEVGASEKASRFFGGIWIPIAGIPRARPELGTRRCGIHSHPTAWRTRSAGCIQMPRKDAIALAQRIDAALKQGIRLPIEVRNPRYFAERSAPGHEKGTRSCPSSDP